jgi:hypothetical protein
MTHQGRVCCLAVMYALLTCAPVSAQLPTAQVSGRVTDQDGGAVSGAIVTVTHAGTGFTRTEPTGATGWFVLSNLPAGPYGLQVSARGFATFERAGLVLEVGTSLIVNPVLRLGAYDETVSVDHAAPRVDATSAGISTVIRQEQILALPLNGRNPVELVAITGAAVQTITSGVTALPGGLGVSVAGGQSFGVTYLLDGAMHNSPQDNLNLPFPFPDALQEFSVATSALTAQHGMHSGAAVNAVTRSGTDRFSGNAFGFLRDRRLNATNPFARVGPEGERVDDGLKRYQFGATAGGPFVRDRLFFFGAYQGTTVRQQPAANIAWVPTPAMLAGDFTAIASPQCNGGRQITLGGGFENNRIDPARFSRAALNLVKHLPASTDPCGQVTYTLRKDNHQSQVLGRLDLRRTDDHWIFARYMATSYDQSLPMRESDSVLSLYDAENTRPESGFDDLAQSLALGDTRVFGSNIVNSARLVFNRSVVSRSTPDTFGPYDLGSDAYGYYPHVMEVNVQGGFVVANQGPSRFVANAAQVSNDLTMVRGRHQISLGGTVSYWHYRLRAHARSGGLWRFTGQATGLGLADLLVGRVGTLTHSGPAKLLMDQWYLGLYAQDTWRMSGRVTVNAGLRWEPYFGQNILNGAAYNFSPANFRDNVGSTVFRYAPAGLLFPGDAGFPPGRSGAYTQWWNLAPRASVGWDVGGDGQTALRAGYGLSYDFSTAEYHLMNAQAAPFGNRTLLFDPPGGFDRPYADLGGDPHPIVTSPETRFVEYGAFGVTDPHINSPRVQHWNLTVERHIGARWHVAASYLGSRTDRLWNQVALNPGVFVGREPCTLNGVSYAVCSNDQNLNQRRVLSLSGENPAAARLIGNLDLHTDLGTQSYRGLTISAQRRSINRVMVNANYTLSRCHGDPALQTGGFQLVASGYTNPADPAFDRGPCDQDRTHLANLMVVAQMPEFASAHLRRWVSGWRGSAIVVARSGSPINVVVGQDRAFTGILNQRPNQVLDNPYGGTLDRWLNPAAFEAPAPGTLGNVRRNSLRGPAFWSMDLALSKFLAFNADRQVEFRVEAFNLLNTFNWGAPISSTGARTDASLSSGSFGRITSMAGTPRVMQLGIKFRFD